MLSLYLPQCIILFKSVTFLNWITVYVYIESHMPWKTPNIRIEMLKELFMGKLYMEEPDTRRESWWGVHCSETLILSLNLTFKQYHRPSYSFERVSSDHTRSFVSIKNVSIHIYLFFYQINAIGHLYHMTDVATISYKMMLPSCHRIIQNSNIWRYPNDQL